MMDKSFFEEETPTKQDQNLNSVLITPETNIESAQKNKDSLKIIQVSNSNDLGVSETSLATKDIKN